MQITSSELDCSDSVHSKDTGEALLGRLCNCVVEGADKEVSMGRGDLKSVTWLGNGKKESNQHWRNLNQKSLVEGPSCLRKRRRWKGKITKKETEWNEWTEGDKSRRRMKGRKSAHLEVGSQEKRKK